MEESTRTPRLRAHYYQKEKTCFKLLIKFGSFSKRTIGQQRVARVINLAIELFFFQ